MGLVKVEYNIFYLSLDHDIEVSREFVDECLSS